MYQILLKAIAFVFTIFLGYFLKKKNFFTVEDSKFVNKTVINLTLPSAIISSFGTFQKENSLFVLVILGFLCNIVLISLGYLFSKKKSSDIRALYMLNFSGYNIGAFTLPFIQNFLGSFSVVAICMFDIGNSISCTGGSYAITSTVIAKNKEKFSVKFLLKRLFNSIPFVTYITILFFIFLNIKIPQPILAITSLIGGANGFMAMLMIGLMLEIQFKWTYISKAIIILGIRYSFGVICAIIFYFFLPLPLELKQVLVIGVFAPISALSSFFTKKIGSDYNLASFTSSVSIIISLIIMTFLIITMNI